MKKLPKIKFLLMTFSALFLFSCIKEELNAPEIITDPPQYEIREYWKEIEKRIDSEEWQTINSGDTLQLALNYTNASKSNLGGTYYYNFTNLNIDIDSIGDVKVGEDDITFIPLTSIEDSISLPIQLIESENDTLLVIRNILNTPITEVKYKKVDFRE